MLDYQNREVCRQLVTEKTGLNPSDLNIRLELTSGIDLDGVRHYRPYYVAAQLLRERPDVLVALPGGVEKDVQTAAKELMNTQAGLDGLLTLSVPPGAEATIKVTPTLMSGTIPIVTSW